MTSKLTSLCLNLLISNSFYGPHPLSRSLTFWHLTYYILTIWSFQQSYIAPPQPWCFAFVLNKTMKSRSRLMSNFKSNYISTKCPRWSFTGAEGVHDPLLSPSWICYRDQGWEFVLFTFNWYVEFFKVCFDIKTKKKFLSLLLCRMWMAVVLQEQLANDWSQDELSVIWDSP